MERVGRPDDMSDLEWLVAIEEIRQLKAKRDRYVDAHDWDAYEALHAPDHVSHNDGQVAWTSSAETIANVSRIMDGMITAHHSYSPEILFDTATTARGIWSMIDGIVTNVDGRDTWSFKFGYYYETYEKREGRWLFTSRRWHDYFGTGPNGVTFPRQMPMGSDAWLHILQPR